MTPESAFAHAGSLALAGWVVLLLAPRRWPLLNAVPGLVIPALLSVFYTVLILQHFGASEGGYGTLAEVRVLLSGDWLLLAAWVHFLAFDLFAGAWMAKRMDEAHFNRILQAPILLAILYFGPAGFLLGLIATGTMRLPSLTGPGPRDAHP